MRPLHEPDSIGVADFRRLQVGGGREPEAAAAYRPRPNPRWDVRAAQVELASPGVPQQRRLEAGGVAHGKELLRVRPGAARAAQLCRYVEIDVDLAVAGAGIAFATSG